jgi:hypothetical protein
MVNRAAVILKYRKPAIRWINDVDSYESDRVLSQEEVNTDRTVYLISEEDGDGEIAVRRWVRANYEELFEYELGGWYTDPSLWPEERTGEMFCDWFEIEWHSVLIDTVDGELYNEDF